MGKKVRDKCLTRMVGKEKSRDPNGEEWNRTDSPIMHSKNLPGSGGSKNDLKNRSVSGTEQRGWKRRAKWNITAQGRGLSQWSLLDTQNCSKISKQLYSSPNTS